jgi:hypothetical protein
MPKDRPTKEELVWVFVSHGPYAVDYMLLGLQRSGEETERARRKAVYDDWRDEGSPRVEVPSSMVSRCVEIVLGSHSSTT